MPVTIPRKNTTMQHQQPPPPSLPSPPTLVPPQPPPPPPPRPIPPASPHTFDRFTRFPASSVELFQRETHDLVMGTMAVLGVEQTQKASRPSSPSTIINLPEISSLSTHFISLGQRPFFSKSTPGTMALDITRSLGRDRVVLRSDDQIWISNSSGTECVRLQIQCPTLDVYAPFSPDIPNHTAVIDNAEKSPPPSDTLDKVGPKSEPHHDDDDSDGGICDFSEDDMTPLPRSVAYLKKIESSPAKNSISSASPCGSKHVAWGVHSEFLPTRKGGSFTEVSRLSLDDLPAPPPPPPAVETAMCVAVRRSAPSCLVLRDGKEFTAIECGQRLVMGGSCTNMPLPWIQDPNQVVAEIIYAAEGTIHLSIITSNSSSNVSEENSLFFMTIPNDVLFPLCKDDVLVMKSGEEEGGGGATTDIRDFAILRMDESCRAMSKPDTDERPNANQLLGVLGLECVSREHFNSVRGASGTKESFVSYVVPPDMFTEAGNRHFITVGRREGENDIVVRDQYFASIQFAIRRELDLGYTLVPIPNTKNSTKLLLGRGTTHYRPPLQLVQGDVFYVGKTQIKVMMVHNNNNKPATATSSYCEIPISGSQMLDDIETCSTSQQVCLRLGVEEPCGVAILLRATSLTNKKSQLFMCTARDIVIGSCPSANICLMMDRSVSSLHCRLKFNGNYWTLQDLESSRGTFIKVRECTMLTAGDVISIGMTEITVVGEPLNEAGQVRLKGLRGKRLSKLKMLIAS